MAWCPQATSHYPNQCWPRSMSPYGISRPQWINWNYRQHIFAFASEWCFKIFDLFISTYYKVAFSTDIVFLMKVKLYYSTETQPLPSFTKQMWLMQKTAWCLSCLGHSSSGDTTPNCSLLPNAVSFNIYSKMRVGLAPTLFCSWDWQLSLLQPLVPSMMKTLHYDCIMFWTICKFQIIYKWCKCDSKYT